MSNTRPLAPANINPWARSIERDVDGLLRKTGSLATTADQALRAANAAVAGLTQSVETDDWNTALLPGVSYWGINAAGQPPTGDDWWVGSTAVLPRADGQTIIRQTLTRPNLNSPVDFSTRVSLDNGASWTPWAVSGDTWWVNLSSFLTSGFTGTVEGRRIGDSVRLRSNDLAGSFPSAAPLTNFITLPTEWRPSANEWGTAWSATGHTGAVLVRSSGLAGISNMSGSTWTSVRIGISYFTG